MRRPKRRIKSRFVLGALTALIPLWVHANVRGELRVLRSQEAALQQGLNRTLRDRSQALDALRLSEDHVAKVGRTLALTQMHEQRLKGKIAVLKVNEGRLQQTERRERAHIARQAVAAYMIGRADSLELFFSQEDPQLVARMLMYYRYVLRSRARHLQVARQTLQAMTETAAMIRAKMGQLRVLAQAELAQKKRLLGALAQRAEVVQALNGRTQSGRSRIIVLRARAHRLQALLRGLRRLPAVWTDSESARAVCGFSW